jgi:hypothetical protein
MHVKDTGILSGFCPGFANSLFLDATVHFRNVVCLQYQHVSAPFATPGQEARCGRIRLSWSEKLNESISQRKNDVAESKFRDSGIFVTRRNAEYRGKQLVSLVQVGRDKSNLSYPQHPMISSA